MSWKMIGEPKTRKCTKSLAEEFAGMTPAPHDRPLNATRSSVLRKAFELGRFRTCEWATAYCESTKQTYRVNGKHTSTVLASMNGQFPKHLSVIVEHFECDTLEDVAQLYCTFDTKSSARSTGDINRIYSAVLPELDEIAPKIINICVTGMSYKIWEEMAGSHSADDRAQLILGNAPFIIWVDSLLGHTDAKKVKHLLRGATVSAMFATWGKAKGPATEFWTAVRDATGTKPDLPDRKLEKWLWQTVLKRTTTDRVIVGTREMYVKCLHAWNSWRKNEPTNLAYFANSKTPSAV